MGRWTQYDDDSYRVPEGVERIGYDADTGRYSFRDATGCIFESSSPDGHGRLDPTPTTGSHILFGSDALEADIPSPISPSRMTFHDILPANLITSASAPKHSREPSSPTLAGTKATVSRFASVVRRATIPKMHGVVLAARHKATSSRQHPKLSTSAAGKLDRDADGGWEPLVDDVDQPSPITMGRNTSTRSSNSKDSAHSVSSPTRDKAPRVSHRFP